MNWMKKGPELKMPSFLKRSPGTKRSGPELPPFLNDLYYDLRERRLLPLVALALVAIVAAPFLLGGGSDEEGAEAGAADVAGASRADMPAFTVVESKPGLRDYHKRFENRSPSDPFKQRYRTSGLGNAQLNEPSQEPGGGGGGGEAGGDEGGGGGGGTTPAPEVETPAPGGPGRGGIVFFAWAIDLTIKKVVPSSGGGKQSFDLHSSSAAGKVEAETPAAEDHPSGRVELASKPEKTVRHKVLPQTNLPGDKRPVATYMGRSKRGLPLFLVSDTVKSVFGESQCVSGADVCQLIEVEPNFPITFVYGANEIRYTFNVQKMHLVVTGRSKD